jgi:uncharacterized lipoprotein YmbA
MRCGSPAAWAALALVFEPVAVASDLDNVGVVQQAVEIRKLL